MEVCYDNIFEMLFNTLGCKRTIEAEVTSSLFVRKIQITLSRSVALGDESE